MSDKVTELTEGLLKSLMPSAVVGRGIIISDFNTCLAAGVYRVGVQTLNGPEGVYQYGVLIVFATPAIGQDFAVQIYIPDSMEDTVLAVRMYWAGTFREWKSINASA